MEGWLALLISKGYKKTLRWGLVFIAVQVIVPQLHKIEKQGYTYVSPDSQAPAYLTAPLKQYLLETKSLPEWTPYIFGGMPSVSSGIYNYGTYLPNYIFDSWLNPTAVFFWIIFFHYLIPREAKTDELGDKEHFAVCGLFFGLAAIFFIPTLFFIHELYFQTAHAIIFSFFTSLLIRFIALDEKWNHAQILKRGSLIILFFWLVGLFKLEIV